MLPGKMSTKHHFLLEIYSNDLKQFDCYIVGRMNFVTLEMFISLYSQITGVFLLIRFL